MYISTDNREAGARYLFSSLPPSHSNPDQFSLAVPLAACVHVNFAPELQNNPTSLILLLVRAGAPKPTTQLSLPMGQVLCYPHLCVCLFCLLVRKTELQPCLPLFILRLQNQKIPKKQP